MGVTEKQESTKWWRKWGEGLAAVRRLRLECSCGMSVAVASDNGWVLTETREHFESLHTNCEGKAS